MLLVLFYAVRENSFASNERLPKKNVYVLLKRCYVMFFRDVKTRIFRGKASLIQIFADASLWLNRQSSPFINACRVEKVKLAM